MSDTARAQLQKDIEKAQVDAQRFDQDAQAEVNELQQELQDQFQAKLMPILEALSDDSPSLLLEPTAGQGQSLVKKLDDLENYLKALEYHPKVGICLDTCHVFAAGHDISKKGGMTETLDRKSTRLNSSH